MNIQQLRYVVAIANSGTFREAAEKMYVSQPSLSISVRDLEKELGFKIFRRTSSGTFLTRRGMEFYEKAQELVKGFDVFQNQYANPEEEKDEFFSTSTSKKYQYTDLNRSYQNTYIRDKKDFQNDMVFLTIASLIAVISLIGMSALSVSKEIKTYSIYCLNGMTRKQCIGINAVYICLLVIISVCIAFVVKFIYGYLNYFKMYTDISAFRSEAVAKEFVRLSDYFSIGWTEAVAVIILLCVSFISAMIITYITLKKA